MTDIKEQDQLDDKKLKAEENADRKGKEEKKEEKGLSEEERKIVAKAADKKISKEDARKEVARDTVREETGYSIESLADVGRKVMHTSETIDHSKYASHSPTNRVHSVSAKAPGIKGAAIEGMLEKMTDHRIADKIVQAGLGAEFTSTGASGLEHSAKAVLEEIQKNGDEKGLEKMLAAGALHGAMTLDQIRKLTVEKLREVLNTMRAMTKPREIFPRTPEKGPGPAPKVEPPRIPDRNARITPPREAPEHTIPVPERDTGR